MGNRIFSSIFVSRSGGSLFSSLAVAAVAVFLAAAPTGTKAAELYAQVGPADAQAAANTSNHHYHLLALRNAPHNLAAQTYPPLAGQSRGELYSSTQNKAGTNRSTPAPLTTFYPADLSQTGGGSVLTTAVSHPVYVNCATPATCWGNPAGFLGDLGKSTFIHLTDQYVGSVANNRYTVGNSVSLSYRGRSSTLGMSDLLSILHSAVVANGRQTGYGHIYHIFLPKGTDVCASGGSCYSPDYPSYFAFCAFHSSTDYSDVGHVLFTVEPYQGVPGCQEQASTGAFPNGQLADSTNSTLSHEQFETITDPDGSAWYVAADLDLYGSEIGDVCQSETGLPGAVQLNSKPYQLQLEYSNASHSCSFTN